FGFLRAVAIDQHLLVRGREEDLLEVLAARPELLGIGLDEGTALVVRGDRAEVVGRSVVAFYDNGLPDDGVGGPGEPTQRELFF
ncbi:MAG: peptidase S51, partial [Gemmatimonadetes bacterium]|nr:peptidase S51 [Gemmatimonadota bacterium]NIQ57211.1 peptidase S51 [Gemmatimonadota bacterium]NIU77382.1 peptidase S51 [Gammaproteobacteria bacterium]NIX46624.1 peptidase S51 [Gemmatimonadota bacterium]NIY10965.1 peptidase S51 [Gemmatimonadota bacterium]